MSTAAGTSYPKMVVFRRKTTATCEIKLIKASSLHKGRQAMSFCKRLTRIRKMSWKNGFLRKRPAENIWNACAGRMVLFAPIAE